MRHAEAPTQVTLMKTRAYGHGAPSSLHILLALALLPPTALGQIFGCDDDKKYGPEYDGRQNPDRAAKGYIEWWFFTAYSEAEDLGAVITYHPSTTDPSVSCMLYSDASKPTATTVRIGNAFASGTSSASNATMTVGSDGRVGVTVIDAQTYRIRGALGDSPKGNVTWDLTFTQAVDPAREHVDVFGLLKLDWISYMPSANVSGEVTWLAAAADDASKKAKASPRKFNMAGAHGYHDHNSGKWPKVGASAASGTPDAVAAHAQGISFDYKWGSTGNGKDIGAVYGTYFLPGPFANKTVGYIFVRVKGQRIKFGTLCLGDSMHVAPLGFITHSDGHTEATAVHLQAENRDWKLDWVHERKSSATGGGGGLGLVVYEQLSMHNLTLTPKTNKARAGGDGAQLINAFGYTEWSNPA